MKLIPIKDYMGYEFYINSDAVAYIEETFIDDKCYENRNTIIHFTGGKEIIIGYPINEVIEMLENKKHGSFDTDDFFNAAVKRSYRNTCVCCGKEIPEGWQICTDCAEKNK